MYFHIWFIGKGKEPPAALQRSPVYLPKGEPFSAAPGKPVPWGGVPRTAMHEAARDAYLPLLLSSLLWRYLRHHRGEVYVCPAPPARPAFHSGSAAPRSSPHAPAPFLLPSWTSRPLYRVWTGSEIYTIIISMMMRWWRFEPNSVQGRGVGSRCRKAPSPQRSMLSALRHAPSAGREPELGRGARGEPNPPSSHCPPAKFDRTSGPRAAAQQLGMPPPLPQLRSAGGTGHRAGGELRGGVEGWRRVSPSLPAARGGERGRRGDAQARMASEPTSAGKGAGQLPLSPSCSRRCPQCSCKAESTRAVPSSPPLLLLILPWRCCGPRRQEGSRARLGQPPCRASPAGCAPPARAAGAPRSAPCGPRGREGRGNPTPGHSHGTRRVAYLELLRVQVSWSVHRAKLNGADWKLRKLCQKMKRNKGVGGIKKGEEGGNLVCQFPA